jgi:hypothetical protein
MINDPAISARIDAEWDSISRDYEAAYAVMPVKYMERIELSFHPYVKLLGYLCLDVQALSGDVVEIGVWKGKSLAFMKRFASEDTKFIGIDPFELRGQEQEMAYFHQTLLPSAQLIKGYSQFAIATALGFSKHFKILHIDGGHMRAHVWSDFLLYERAARFISTAPPASCVRACFRTWRYRRARWLDPSSRSAPRPRPRSGRNTALRCAPTRTIR